MISKQFFIALVFFTLSFSFSSQALQVDKIQHGKLVFSEEDLERTYTLPQTVNPERSFITLSVISRAEEADEAALKVAADFLDRRTVRVVRQQKGAGIEVAVSVAEFKSGARVRRGVTEFSQDVYQKRVAISKVESKNAWVLLDVTAASYLPAARAHLHFLPQLADSHTLVIKRTDAVVPKPEILVKKQIEAAAQEPESKKKESDYLRLPMPRAQLYWQLVEFDEGVKVQKGSAKMPDFAVDTSAYLSDSVRDQSRSFFHYYWIAGQGVASRRDLSLVQADLPEDNQLVFKRKEKTEDRDTDLEIQWNLVELLGAANQVQRGVAYFGSKARDQVIQIKKTNPNRALVFLQVLGGKNAANYSEGEQSSSFSFISEFDGAERLLLRRGGAAAVDAEVSWTVVEFAPLTLNLPVGGEVFRVGETIEIRWNYSADMLVQGKGAQGEQLVDVQISFEGGRDEFKHTLAKAVSITNPSFKWIIPDTVNDKTVITKEAIVRIVVPDLEGKNTDETRVPFQIKGVIQLISPNGGERWYVGETERKIEWEYKGRLGVLSIYYDRESGYGFDPFPRKQRIARVVPGKNGKGSFTWNPIPDLTLTRARIKIVSEADESVYSISDKDFEIVPGIELQISAKDAEAYNAGRFLDLKWVTTGTIDFFSLYYQTDMYADWKLAKEKIPGGAAGNYSFRWLVPAEAESDTLRLKITRTSDLQVFDTAPDDLGGYIAVKAWLKLVDPTENDIPVWRTGEKRAIEWDFGGNIEYLKFEYSLDGGESWIKEAVLDARVRRYEWLIPDANSGEVLIRLSDVNRPRLSSESNAPFEIRDFSEEGNQAAEPATWWVKEKDEPVT